jgi:hypothetical protein
MMSQGTEQLAKLQGNDPDPKRASARNRQHRRRLKFGVSLHDLIFSENRYTLFRITP